MKPLRLLAPLILLCLALASCSPPPGEAEALILHPKNKKLTLGLTVVAATHLSVEVRPPDAEVCLQWFSSDEAVASVDERGVVTAHRPGRARITVRDTVSGRKSVCSLRIDSMPAELTLSAAEARLKPGWILNLSPELVPKQYIQRINQVITWTTSDPEVAVVDARGRVTAVAPGTAVIRAETVNGLTAECSVIVEEG